MNHQPPEKQNLDIGLVLDVHSIFKTIQGEGPFTGQRSIFIRLAGCNLQCPMCDTDYTSDRRFLSVSQIIDMVNDHAHIHSYLVVITGGEPFRQNIKHLVEVLLANGHQVQIETNGTLYQELPYDQITVVCSPKTGNINRQLLPHIDAFKYVLHADQVSEDDGLPFRALEHPAHPRLARPPKGYAGRIYVQPTDEGNLEKNSQHLSAAINSSMEYGYTLCLQTHKIINME